MITIKRIISIKITGLKQRRCLVSLYPQWKTKSLHTFTHLLAMGRSDHHFTFLTFGQIDEQNRNLMQSTVIASQGENMWNAGVRDGRRADWPLEQSPPRRGQQHFVISSTSTSTFFSSSTSSSSLSSLSPVQCQVLLSVVNKVDVRARHKIHQSIYFNSEVHRINLPQYYFQHLGSSFNLSCR